MISALSILCSLYCWKGRIRLFESKCLRELLLHPSLRPKLALLVRHAISPRFRDVLLDLAEGSDTVDSVLEHHGNKRGGEWLKTLIGIQPAIEDRERADQTFQDILLGMKAARSLCIKGAAFELGDTEVR